MEKLDFKKTLKHLYQASAKDVMEVTVPELNYLMIDGLGDPNHSKPYAEAVEALYAASYTIKFMIKKSAKGIDYAVMPLEGLWWADDMSKFSVDDKSNWKWTMMIMQPEMVTMDIVKQAIAEVKLKKGLAALPLLRFENFKEGRCAQIMHIGPFSEEGPAIQKVHEFIAQKSKLKGKHHEIYLSDIRKAEPAKWKTIIRQPMQ